MSPQYGFTVVELLVVIVVIALLSSIILPICTKVREKSHQSVCLSNVRQIGVAIAAYRQDFDERYPVATTTPTQGIYLWSSTEAETLTLLSNAPTIKSALSPYTKSAELWRCPADIGGTAALNTAANTGNPAVLQAKDSFYESIGTSYMYRTEAGFVGANEDDEAVDFSDAKLSLSQVAILIDGSNWHFADRPNVVLDYLTTRPTFSGFRTTLFADGHVKALPEKECITLWIGSLGVP